MQISVAQVKEQIHSGQRDQKPGIISLAWLFQGVVQQAVLQFGRKGYSEETEDLRTQTEENPNH